MSLASVLLAGDRRTVGFTPPREPGHPQRGRALTIPRRVHQDRARGTRPPESQQRPGDSGIIAGNGPALLAPSPEERGMSSYQITRVRRSSLTAGDHQHVVGVEIVCTAEQVHAWMRGGDEFFTYSPSTGRWVIVEPWQCCGVNTLRSPADAVYDSNLDDLPPC